MNVHMTETPAFSATQIQPNIRARIRNVLFATDFSSASKAALPYAADIARRHGARLYAAHVCPLQPQPPIAGMYGSIPVPAWSPSNEEAEVRARAEAQALVTKLYGIKCSILVSSGEVWPVLAEMIGKHEIDFVVTGTHGRTGLGKLFLGSVAEAIFRTASPPVLTVGPHCAEHSNRADGFQRILFATNFNTESHAAANWAISLAEENAAHLMLLHVIEPPGSST